MPSEDLVLVVIVVWVTSATHAVLHVGNGVKYNMVE